MPRTSNERAMDRYYKAEAHPYKIRHLSVCCRPIHVITGIILERG